jgi:hypothetical protein
MRTAARGRSVGWKTTILPFFLLAASCTEPDVTDDAGTADSGPRMIEVSTTGYCYSEEPMCAWSFEGMCQIMARNAEGGGLYHVDRIRLNRETAKVWWDDYPDTARSTLVAYVDMTLETHIWGKRLDSLTAKTIVNEDCNTWIEDWTSYSVGDRLIVTLWYDDDLGAYVLQESCMDIYFLRNGKASYGCLGPATIPEIQAIFEKARRPDGTYDCSIPEGQCYSGKTCESDEDCGPLAYCFEPEGVCVSDE